MRSVSVSLEILINPPACISNQHIEDWVYERFFIAAEQIDYCEEIELYVDVEELE